jgi:hypothetical protein
MTSNLQKTIENIFRLKGILYAVHDSRVYVTDISEAEDQLVNIGFGLDDYATCYMKDKHKVHTFNKGLILEVPINNTVIFYENISAQRRRRIDRTSTRS